MWRAAIPRFTPDSLERNAVERPFRIDEVQPLESVRASLAQDQTTVDVFSARSPDQRYQLVFDRYQSIGEDGGQIEIGGEPDSAPLLLDNARGVSNRLEFCGTPCRFEWGVWLTSTSFALGGSEEADSKGNVQRGRLQIYSLSDSTKTTYVTRPLTSQEFARYRGAWESWVISRYRALKRPA